MPQYLFNPHRHVKIWLSPNPDVFLNMMNQLRFIHMRVINPNDEIHFVYDSRLLQENALIELFKFCNLHQIIPVNVKEEVIPHCNTLQEQNMLVAYHEEIFNLDKGGNLASASDKLRLLSPIYRLGVYSDFDVDINTQHLPPLLEVNAPILISIGSFFPDSQSTEERICLNNDIFAVIDEQDAKFYIERIQNIGLQLFNVQIDQTHNPYLNMPMCCEKLLHKLSLEQNARQIRHSVLRLSKTNELFYRMLIHGQNLVIFKERIFFLNGTPSLTDKDFQSIYHELHHHLKNQSPEPLTLTQLLDFHREKFIDACIEKTVLDTTGPSAYCYGLFLQNQFNAEDMINKVSPFALHTYGLGNSFKSDNTCPMHSSIQVKEEYFSKAKNDLSWKFFGMNKLKKTEKEMEHAASIIQKAFRR